MNLSTAFFGSSSYVLPLLDTLKQHTQLKLIVTQPDKPVGRKQTLTPSPPKIWAKEHGLPAVTPADLMPEKNKIVDLVKHHGIELAVVADYGLLIPKEIFDLPKWKTINIHFSKLPDLAGPSPVQWTILRGDKEAWISFFLLVEELDAGPILSQKGVPLFGVETTGQLYQALFVKASQLLPDVLSSYIQGSLKPYPQDKSKTTYTRRLTRDDGFIPLSVLKDALNGKGDKNWQPNFLPASCFMFPASIVIERLLHAFTPWPGVWTILGSRKQEAGNRKIRMKILKAHVERERLVIEEVQLEGKKPVHWREFQKANPDIF